MRSIRPSGFAASLLAACLAGALAGGAASAQDRETICRADLNDNGVVNFRDLAIFRAVVEDVERRVTERVALAGMHGETARDRLVTGAFEFLDAGSTNLALATETIWHRTALGALSHE